MTNLDSIFRSRDIILPTKIHIVKAIVFPVIMYGCESWIIKKAEGWRIDAFKLWCWRRLLRVPWTARRSKQSVIKEINFEYSLEGLMLKLKLQYFGHLMQKTDSLENTLMLGKIEGRKRRGWQKTRRLDGTPTHWKWVWASSGDGEGQGSLACCSSWSCQELDTTEQLNNNNNIFIIRIDSETEAPILWSPDANSWLIGKYPDAGKDWRQKGKRVTEDEMVGWHHWWQWTWTWANSGRWWGTGRPGVLQSMGSQRVRQDLVTEQQQLYIFIHTAIYTYIYV